MPLSFKPTAVFCLAVQFSCLDYAAIHADKELIMMIRSAMRGAGLPVELVEERIAQVCLQQSVTFIS